MGHYGFCGGSSCNVGEVYFHACVPELILDTLLNNLHSIIGHLDAEDTGSETLLTNPPTQQIMSGCDVVLK